MKAVMIMPALLLQRASVKTKSRVNKETLNRRLKLWEENKIYELLQEARTLQNELPESSVKMTDEEVTKRFTNFMLAGNVKQSVRLLERDASTNKLSASSVANTQRVNRFMMKWSSKDQSTMSVASFSTELLLTRY